MHADAQLSYLSYTLQLSLLLYVNRVGKLFYTKEVAICIGLRVAVVKVGDHNCAVSY